MIRQSEVRKIYCVHQGYELYGSDRTFISCVGFLYDRYPGADITVLLPKVGPLSAEFERLGYKVEVRDLWVLRKSYGITGLALRLLRLPAFIAAARRTLRACDLLYVNTGVIVDFLLAARSAPRKAVIHVHEIPTGKSLPLFRYLIGFSGAPVMFNSVATQKSLAIPASSPQAVVYNGIDIAGQPDAGRTVDGSLRILMIGRINSWKGQDLLVEALSELGAATLAKIKVRIVGDVFEGAPFRKALGARIEAAGLKAYVQMEGFTEDPSEAYRWSDVVVVPSRKPEPFGLVAIEAMAYSKPVIAADHGGLAEIVGDGETGWCFPPNNAAALASVIARAVDDPVTLARLGAAGRRRYEQQFTLAAFERSFIGAVDSSGYAAIEAPTAPGAG